MCRVCALKKRYVITRHRKHEALEQNCEHQPTLFLFLLSFALLNFLLHHQMAVSSRVMFQHLRVQVSCLDQVLKKASKLIKNIVSILWRY